MNNILRCALPALFLWSAGSTVHSQGLLNFVNKITGTLSARVYVLEAGSWVPVDGRFVAQLYAAPPGGTLAAVGPAIRFRDNPVAGQGYWVGAGIVIPDVPAQALAQVKVVVWAAEEGASYDAVRASGGRCAESDVVWVRTGGGVEPPTPLYGLEPIGIAGPSDAPVTSAASFSETLVLPSGQPQLTIQGAPGRTYLIERGPIDSLARQWITAGTVVTDANGAATFVDRGVSAAGANTKFEGGGSQPFCLSDLRDPAAFAVMLRNPADKVCEFVRDALTTSTAAALTEWQPTATGELPPRLGRALVEELNRLPGRWTPDEGALEGMVLRQETKDLLQQDPAAADRRRLNRLLMEDAFPTELHRSPGAVLAVANSAGAAGLPASAEPVVLRYRAVAK